MLFNSFDFAVFLPLVFIFYWLLRKKLSLQNSLVVIASYVFYGWWDYRFLSLIILSTVVDYAIGLRIGNAKFKSKRQLLLWTSLLVNLGILGYFKYYNFFLENFVSAFSLFGYEITIDSIKVILPVGISFYTFQTLSYTIDVYRDKITPTNNFIQFAAYVSFFPQLVAGPIERATNLLPQFNKRRTFNYDTSVGGLRLILWGLFKKMVIADNCAIFANEIFNNSGSYEGSTLLLGALFFTFQIYGDFSGYSDIAIGTARLFGFNLMRNFAFPYFSRDIAEFWRRWHISLSTWFRDYLYIPLGGSKVGEIKKIRNTFIIFIVSGFWHGANWTFIIWGLLNAVYFLPLLLLKQNRNHLEIVAKGNLLPSMGEIFKIAITFGLTVLAWVFFRSNSVNEAFYYLSGIFSIDLFSMPDVLPVYLLTLLILFLLVEWIGREFETPIIVFNKIKIRPVRWALYLVISISLFTFAGGQQDFIYFQF